ncbi:MAG: CAP domain-containing protein, partial [Chloroflexota bacterium]
MPVHRRIAALAVALLLTLPGFAVRAGGTPPPPYPELEAFALGLVNCVRTGGLVDPAGDCRPRKGPVRKLPPLVLHPGIASGMARPYAQRLARADACTHSLGGRDVDERFDAAGFPARPRSENVGCAYSMSPRAMTIFTHRLMQAERTWNGPHWRNMRDPDWVSAGVGIGMAGNETRIVYAFYSRAPRGSAPTGMRSGVADLQMSRIHVRARASSPATSGPPMPPTMKLSAGATRLPDAATI